MAGRKPKYETHVKPHLQEIADWYMELTEEQIAERLGVSVASFNNYKNEHEELRAILVGARQKLVQDLKQSLKKKAVGFKYTETKTLIRDDNGKEVKTIEKSEKYAQPDTAAIHLLLKNLDDSWHNDDKRTLTLKEMELELKKFKAEQEEWN